MELGIVGGIIFFLKVGHLSLLFLHDDSSFLLLALEVGVLDVLVVLDVSLLMVGSEGLLPFLMEEDAFPIAHGLDVVDKFLDLLFINFIDEVHHHSFRDGVHFSP